MYSYQGKDFRAATARLHWLPANVVFKTAAILALLTIAIRLPEFGNPTYHIDEAFYLLFGAKLNEGLRAYTDIWDRKPFGLFLLYAIISRFGSVYAYQAAAAVFAWGTALTLFAITSRFVGRWAATAAGGLYLALLGALAGGGGQSPVFYNLFIAVAGLLALKKLLGEGNHNARVLADFLAMLLCGLALTIKPTALPEGIFLGIVIVVARWRANRNWLDTSIYSLQLCAVAVFPTALIMGYFWLDGRLDDYLFATVRSIFQTQPLPMAARLGKASYLAGKLWLVTCVALVGVAVLLARGLANGGRAMSVASFVGGWIIAAMMGFSMVPNFYDHYALPVASVLAVAAAAVFDRPRIGRAVAIVAIGQLLLASGYPTVQLMRHHLAREGYEKATHLIATHASRGCVFVFDATPALYRGFATCASNKYAFPEHISNQREAFAIGADPVAALRKVLADRPAVIVMPITPSLYTANETTRAIVQRYVADRYALVGKADLYDVVGRQTVSVWSRKP
jgi:hypothetical protein